LGKFSLLLQPIVRCCPLVGRQKKLITFAEANKLRSLVSFAPSISLGSQYFQQIQPPLFIFLKELNLVLGEDVIILATSFHVDGDIHKGQGIQPGSPSRHRMKGRPAFGGTPAIYILCGFTLSFKYLPI
jgi:hypothetical protein